MEENILPVCRVCLQSSLEYIDFETPLNKATAFDEEHENEGLEEDTKTLTYLDCFRVCTRLELPSSSLEASRSLCAACAVDLLVAYEFLCKAEKSDKILRDVRDMKSEVTATSTEQQEKQMYYEIEVVNEIPNADELSNVFDYSDETDEKESNMCDQLLLDVINDTEEEVKDENILSATVDEQENDEACDDGGDAFEEHVMLDDDFSNLDAECTEEETRETTVNNPLDIGTDNIDSGTKNYECDTCGRGFRNQRALIQHEWRGHKRKQAVTCEICQEKLQIGETLRSHIEKAHAQIVKCEKCDHRCKEYRLREHQVKAHEETELYTCEICARTYISRELLRSHLKYHQRKEAIPKSDACTVCGKRFSTRHYMLRHMRLHSGDRPVHQCTECDKVYMTKTALNMHLRLHTGDTQMCPKCGKIFVRKYELDVHMRFHNRTYPFSCEVCGQSFAIKGHLRSHMWRHQGLKLQCEECGKLFGATKSLHEHSFLHTSMPFPCSYCNKGYPSKQKYKVHLKTSHSIVLDDHEMQRINQLRERKPLQRKKHTLVQADSVMKEVVVKTKDDNNKVNDNEMENVFDELF